MGELSDDLVPPGLHPRLFGPFCAGRDFHRCRLSGRNLAHELLRATLGLYPHRMHQERDDKHRLARAL